MTFYQITGQNKNELLINAKNIINSSMNGILTFANETEDSLYYAITGSTNFVRIVVSGQDPAFNIYVYLVNSSSATTYLDTFCSPSYQSFYLIKFQNGEVAFSANLYSMSGFLNIQFRNLRGGTDYVGYIAGLPSGGRIYINDTSVVNNISSMLIKSNGGLKVAKVFAPFMFTRSGEEWMMKNMIMCFSYFGILKKMLYNGEYWRCIGGSNGTYYHIKDGD